MHPALTFSLPLLNSLDALKSPWATVGGFRIRAHEKTTCCEAFVENTMRCCKVLAYFGCAPVMATPQAPETIERCMPCLKAFCKRPAYFDMYDAKKGEEWEKGPSMYVLSPSYRSAGLHHAHLTLVAA